MGANSDIALMAEDFDFDNNLYRTGEMAGQYTDAKATAAVAMWLISSSTSKLAYTPSFFAEYTKDIERVMSNQDNAYAYANEYPFPIPKFVETEMSFRVRVKEMPAL